MIQETKLTGALFLSKLITQYAQLHEKTVGDGAKQYIRQLGLRTGEWIERFYEDSIEGEWTPDQYAEVIVDLKNSIGGHFSISEIHPDYVVVTATNCPFGDVVQDAPHLCNMTSTVFGGIAARRFGYGKVKLRKRIALGHSGCEVAVYFQPTDKEDGDEYKDLPVTPANGNPFLWEEETIVALNEELEKSDKMINTLLEELEDLRAQVRRESKNENGQTSANASK
ncbi:methanogen output domain 1-containing protein [Evansella sp. LMS18]|uniref:methanogen output domain 1-containing protein n=1 Tax=Evansella sp. LMS18 TaxID=2924033 RepID=UPI0020D0DA34|nr:methanogen output domain 1-containing protein [Evansella sp. LMS18]UTR10027.1 methanogen output domain 1-containing protein [Evansella sp. LMS18]